MSDTDPTEPIEEIKLSLPGLPVYARVARLAVTGLAGRLDFTYDAIEDLRIAVGEVCSLLLDGEAGRVTLRCQVSESALRIEASRDPVGGRLDIADLSREILLAVVDRADLDPEAARITIVKHRQG